MDELDARIRDSVERNKKARECAEATADLVTQESHNLPEEGRERFWEVLAKELKGHLPDQKRNFNFEPMTDREARLFGEEEMKFGKFRGKYIDEVPLDYLEYLADAQRMFSTKIRRYLESKRIKQEIRS